MVGVGFAMLFAGYTLGAYGFSQVRGWNAGLVAILWPGSSAWANRPAPDSGGTTNQSTTAQNQTNPPNIAGTGGHGTEGAYNGPVVGGGQPINPSTGKPYKPGPGLKIGIGTGL